MLNGRELAVFALVIVLHGLRGQDLPVSVPPPICRQIAWDLYEIGFRWDLLSLDLHLSTCPSEEVRHEELSAIFADGQPLRYSKLPTGPVGLACPSVRERAHFLEGL